MPRHEHNIDETIIVFQGEYKIEYGDEGNQESVVVKPGCFFTSRAGTPYTMTSGPEGVTYIETWGVSVTTAQDGLVRARLGQQVAPPRRARAADGRRDTSTTSLRGTGAYEH